MAKRSGCPAKGKRPPSNPFLHGVCLTASSYPACVCAGVSSSPRPVQAQRRRVIYIRGRTRGCAGWRHKCLIRPTSPFAGSNSVGTRKHSATGRYTSDAVPAVVPDGGINALSGLRVLHRFKQRRPAQAQRRRAIHIRRRTCGCAGWRHKCLIRPTGPPAGSNSVGPRKRSAAG